MAHSLNKVMIIGNCGKDPEVRSLGNSGEKVANLRVATTERWNDKASNTQKEQTEWHNVAVFGRLSEIVEKYVKRGSKVYVEGKLITKKWTDNNNNERYTTEIQVNNFNGAVIFLDSKQQQQGQSVDGGNQRQQPQSHVNNTGFQTEFDNPF